MNKSNIIQNKGIIHIICSFPILYRKKIILIISNGFNIISLLKRIPSNIFLQFSKESIILINVYLQQYSLAQPTSINRFVIVSDICIDLAYQMKGLSIISY